METSENKKEKTIMTEDKVRKMMEKLELPTSDEDVKKFAEDNEILIIPESIKPSGIDAE